MIEKIYLVYFKGTVILAMFVRGSLQVEVNLSIAGWSHVQPVLNQFSWARLFIVILVKLVCWQQADKKDYILIIISKLPAVFTTS